LISKKFFDIILLEKLEKELLVMSQEEKIRQLVEKLNYYTKLYDEGVPQVSDFEWDNLYFELQKLEKETGIYLPESPTQHVDFEVVNSLQKVSHSHQMLSLDKTKDIQVIKSFCSQKTMICMGKMDGLTCALRYENGNLVAAETRGNGIIGENILHNALTVKNIPKKINYKGVLEVDGELICTYRDFENFSGEYKNPRNFAAGSIRLLDSQEANKRKLTFIAWDWINNPYDRLGDALVELGKLGFTTVPYWDGIDLTKDNIEEIMLFIKQSCDKESLPIDGLVFKYDYVKDYAAAGQTAHHFKGGMAYKFYDEEIVSYLIDIDYDLGRSGVLTPVAVFEPVDIEGSIVSRASLSNLSIMKETFGTINPAVGSKVWITKRNQIIPKIERAEENLDTTTFIQLPQVCPVCGHKVEIVTSDSGVESLICPNPNCEGKLAVQIEHYCDMVKGMKIRGLSRATIEKLMDKNWLNGLSDLYCLRDCAEEWKKLSGFGEKSVENILTAVEMSKNCELWQFISALGIPLIGVAASKELANTFKTWANFSNSIKENFNIYTLPNFGWEMDKSIKNFDYSEADYIAEHYLNFEQPKESKKEKTLNGITVCITGKLVQYKNRKLFQDDIEAAGGKVASSVTSKTNFLITNDTTSGSSKNVTAQKLGVEIISEQDFIKRFLT
jgi:DNA ligase (NAD+)